MHIYAVHGAPPEILAYGLAKYSRSAQSLDESIEELSAERTEKFLNTFYFQYGHRSIADLAHVAVALEDISMLAAFNVVDEPLWDGQGRSSRYQNFRESGYYVPSDLELSALQQYHEAVSYLIDSYEYFATTLTEVLTEVQERPADMTQAAYLRTLKARAFDVARYFLPLSMHTSNGQITSARVLEQQISRLAGHPLLELREIAARLKEACEQPAYNYTERKLEEVWASEGTSEESIRHQRDLLERAGVLGVRAAPTLVKYVSPSVYNEETTQELRDLLMPYLDRLKESPDVSHHVTLAPEESDYLDAFVCSLMYLVDDQGRSYLQFQPLVRAMPEDEKSALFALSFKHRRPHDDWLRLHRLGYSLSFDLFLDFGSLRDLHRHRRCVQLIPDFKPNLGFDDPAVIFEAALGTTGANLATKKGLVEDFGNIMERAIKAASLFPQQEYLAYLLPLGVRQRALFKMDLAEAAYIIEQRSDVGGHFSYRRVAYEMYQQLCQRYPYLAPIIRVTNPYEVNRLLDR